MHNSAPIHNHQPVIPNKSHPSRRHQHNHNIILIMQLHTAVSNILLANEKAGKPKNGKA